MSFEYWFVRVFEYYLIFCSICMYLLGSFTCCVSSWWRHDLSGLAICFNWVVWPSRCFSWQTEHQGRELEIYQVRASWKANLHFSILKKSPMFALVFVQKALIYLCMIFIYYQPLKPRFLPSTIWNDMFQFDKVTIWRFSKHPDSHRILQDVFLHLTISSTNIFQNPYLE